MANEVRLIDANALRKRMFSYYSCVDENSSKEYYKGETLMNYEVADMIEDCIDNAPTVDAEPVVHGHWVKHNFLGHDQFACSECQTLGSPQWKRCPVCEAKMDGGNEE